MTDTRYKGATLSDCKKYRYQLWRSWHLKGDCALFIMLNPSTADAYRDDPTIRRCMAFAKAWGYGGIRVCNLFGYRATDPKELKLAQYPIAAEPGGRGGFVRVGDNQENDKYILADASESGLIICAWGNHGSFLDRGEEVRRLLKSDRYRIYHLGLNASGQPKHPLYIKADTEPKEWI